METGKRILLMLFVSLAAGEDLQTGKVSNTLIAAGMLAGIACRGSSGDFREILAAIPGMLLPVVLLFLAFSAGGMGAGDIKLLSVVGCFTGAEEVFFCIVRAVAIGGAYGLIRLFREREGFRRFSGARVFLQTCFLRRGWMSAPAEWRQGGIRMHFTVPILISVWIGLEG